LFDSQFNQKIKRGKIMKSIILTIIAFISLNPILVQAQTNNGLSPMNSPNNNGNQPVLIPENPAHNNINQPVLIPENQQNNQQTPQILQPVHINPKPQMTDPRIQHITFTFTNVADYGDCLDILLLSYENRPEQVTRTIGAQGGNACAEQIFSVFGNNLNRDVMLQLIELANFRATSLLAGKLFPSYGLRRRIAMHFGYLYEMDLDDPKMLQYAKKNR
jgi:hypothetical protein